MAEKQTAESFWSRVKRGTDDECWPWQGACNNSGYGSVGWHGKVYCAHRIAAWLTGMVTQPEAPDRFDTGHVLHRCDNRPCCNPNHFFIGTQSENQKDAYAKKRKVQPQGSAHANAKLTVKGVERVRKQYAKLGSFAAVARLHGVCETTIANVIKGRTYGLGR